MALGAAVFLVIVEPVLADLAFSLTPATQPGIGTNLVTFSGAMTNTNPAKNLFLNNTVFELNGVATNHLTVNTNVFYANVPGILASNQTYRDIVFAVALQPTPPPGDYSGTITIQGGTNIFATNDLATQTFHIIVSYPALTITRTNSAVILTWPTSAIPFILQRNPDLAAGNWLTLTNSPVITNGLNQVTIPATTTNQFYRLKYP